MATLCLYCSKPVKRVRRGRGEHVVQEAIGGAVTIKNVCSACNNQFSIIDVELCSRSPLSVVASQQIDAHLWQVWDVDHSGNNLLLEAWPNWTTEQLTLYPQFVFDRNRPLMYGDYEEMCRFGAEDYARVFNRGMLRAFRRYEAGEKRWLHFERIDREHLNDHGYRLPARIFPRLGIFELARRVQNRDKATFIIRYQRDSEKLRVLNALDNWRPAPHKNRPWHERNVGSHLPVFGTVYDAGKVLRALMKNAINLLSYVCVNTDVSLSTFRRVIDVIRGERPILPQMLNANGFVRVADLDRLKGEDAAHMFRVLHVNGHWHIYSAFFGGRIGTFVRFPGPNRETWCCADVTAPLRSANWTVRPSNIIQPIRIQIDWQNPDAIMPSIPLLGSRTLVEVQRVRKPA